MKARTSIICALALAACGEQQSSTSQPKGEPGRAAAEPDEPADVDERDDVDEPNRVVITAVDVAFTQWLEAQNRGDFAAYVELYDPSFRGIRRTSDGAAKKLDLTAWKADRQKMFRKPMEVAADRPTLAYLDRKGPFTYSFVQRWRSGAYADHGRKVLTFDGTGMIIGEELEWSRPGWDDAENDPIDLSDLTGPFTLRMSGTSGASHGDCRDDVVRLHVEDARGTSRSVVIGSTPSVVVDEHDVAGAVTYHPPSRSKKSLFQTGGDACVGLSVELTVQQEHDTIVVIERWEDNESEAGAGTERRLAVTLTPDAAVTTR